MHTTVWLGLAMGAIAVVNPALMAWLWRFPMVPDPTGRRPQGVSSSPVLWQNVHRGLGYVFVGLYLALLVEMVPRAWEFRTASPGAVVHGVLGAFVGVILAFKIAVVRHVPAVDRFGPRLPWIGGALAAATLAVVALGVVPAWRVVQPLTDLPPDLDRGRDLVAVRCVQCHGASTILGEDDDWDETTREMQEFSQEIPGKTEITEPERVLIAAYLTRALGGENDDADDRADAAEDAREDARDDAEDARERDRDEGGGRRRRRGRDH
jgi:mono/diheme cytochrome c family protein